MLGSGSGSKNRRKYAFCYGCSGSSGQERVDGGKMERAGEKRREEEREERGG